MKTEQLQIQVPFQILMRGRVLPLKTMQLNTNHNLESETTHQDLTLNMEANLLEMVLTNIHLSLKCQINQSHQVCKLQDFKHTENTKTYQALKQDIQQKHHRALSHNFSRSKAQWDNTAGKPQLKVVRTAISLFHRSQ